jgi:hypothetical protein
MCLRLFFRHHFLEVLVAGWVTRIHDLDVALASTESSLVARVALLLGHLLVHLKLAGCSLVFLSSVMVAVI